jgi:hypothetical protein
VTYSKTKHEYLTAMIHLMIDGIILRDEETIREFNDICILRRSEEL